MPERLARVGRQPARPALQPPEPTRSPANQCHTRSIPRRRAGSTINAWNWRPCVVLSDVRTPMPNVRWACHVIRSLRGTGCRGASVSRCVSLQRQPAGVLGAEVCVKLVNADQRAPTDPAALTFLTTTTRPSFRAAFKVGEGGDMGGAAVCMARWSTHAAKRCRGRRSRRRRLRHGAARLYSDAKPACAVISPDGAVHRNGESVRRSAMSR